VQTTKVIVQSLDSALLPASKTLANGDQEMVNSHVESDLDHETDAAMVDLDFAFSTLEHGLPVRGEILQLAFVQINAFPAPQIVSTLRELLTEHELIFLIHILRIELADGGWTSRYMKAEPTEGEEAPSDYALNIIIRLLSCTVDAIGIGGWLSSSTNDPGDALDNLLASLRAETSAALEGIHEATFLRGLLAEFLRYSAKLDYSRNLMNNKSIETVHRGETALPLGMKVEGAEIKRKKDDGTFLSDRELAGKISRYTVGKYSFERIRI
jgi:hypothetical protein